MEIIVSYIREILVKENVPSVSMVSPTTAKSDIVGLVRRGLLAEISFNKVKKGYVKGGMFDEVVGR